METTAPESRRKRFIVWGMPRSGTTFLYHTLPQHPEIFVPFRKESHFFSVNYEKGIEWYNSLYKEQSVNELGADINPLYYLDSLSIERALEFDPTIKIVLGVREPVDFAISLYKNLCAHSFPVGTIVEMVKSYNWEFVNGRPLEFSLQNDFLSQRVSQLMHAFGQNLLIYDFRDFDISPLATLNAIEKFLDIEPFFTEENMQNVRINASSRKDFRLVNSLIKNQRILDIAYFLLPKIAVRHGRRLYERISAPKSRDGTRTESGADIPKEQLSEIQALLSKDRDYYEALFSHTSILTGDGRAFLRTE